MKARQHARPNGLGNDHIAATDADLAIMQAECEHHLESLFHALGIDLDRDPNMIDSPRRIATMLVHEVFGGRTKPRPKITTFPNTRKLDELYSVGPLVVRSTCSHHLAPIIGHAWIGIIPGEKLMGLSKFSRIVDWIMRRPQLQEEATAQIADELENLIAPRGLAVIVKARHMCLEWRGVCEHEAEMITSVMRGIFRTNGDARAELLALVK